MGMLSGATEPLRHNLHIPTALTCQKLRGDLQQKGTLIGFVGTLSERTKRVRLRMCQG